MSEDYRQLLGRRGEEIAENYLTGKGYRILHRNFRASRGEIDLIAVRGKTVVFVEVKSGRSTSFGEAEYRVTPAKQRQLYRIARVFLDISKYPWEDCRFDVVAVELQGPKPRLRHIENAFYLL